MVGGGHCGVDEAKTAQSQVKEGLRERSYG